jgi:hypothetical protein
MKFAIVTNCSARKSVPADSRLSARTLRRGTADEVAEEWAGRIRDAKQWMPAARLYQGRGISEAKLAAEIAQYPLHIVSAGLAFLRDSDLVPPYNLTVSEGMTDSIQGKISGYKPKEWWSALHSAHVSQRSLGGWITSLRDTLFVFALTPNYISLISGELNRLPDKELERIRFTGLRTKSELPDALKALVMPYDRRLNGRDSPVRGTESDFPQRAARHFASLLQDCRRTASAAHHAKMVRNAIDGWRYEIKETRLRLNDMELRCKIKEMMGAGLRWTVALRVLRTELKLACEQNRFQSTWKEMANKNAKS